MIHAHDFLSKTINRGYTLFTGVPCSFFKSLINYVISYPDLEYISASSEGEAVGIAAGAHLAGRKTVVMCQNSGLGNMVNPLTSLNYPFQIPTLIIITWRGEPGLDDEPQHELMGQITCHLLDIIGLQWEFFPLEAEKVDSTLQRADVTMEATGLPYALVMKKGSVFSENMVKNPQGFGDSDDLLSCRSKGTDGAILTRMEAIEVIRDTFTRKDALVATTGKIGRELYTLGDRENNLYVVGSMGCASGIGFGIQWTIPGQRIVVLDGDGAALMKLGTMATIGHYGPERLVHIILDNQSYESTGGQKTVSSTVDFCSVALACGYRKCKAVNLKDNLRDVLKSVGKEKGPVLIHVKVKNQSDTCLGRPTLRPYQVKDRFMGFLKKNNHVAIS